MTTNVQPLSKTVKDAVRKSRSPGRHLSPALVKLLNLIMFSALLAGCVMGTLFLWRMAMNDSRFRLDGETLGLGGSVRECPESLGEISSISKSFHGRSILDPRLVSDLEAAYGGSVWVRKVARMRRSFPNRIDLELQLRLPVAQVKNNQRYWMIDMDGVLLPVTGQPHPFAGLPEIVGVTSNTLGGRPSPGERWSDEGVSGGLGVLKAFWASPLSEALPVARIVVNTGVFNGAKENQREIRRRFEVVTKTGSVVRWGTYNDSAAPGDELTSSEKMWNLQELLGRDEALKEGVCFDVRTRLPGFSLIGQ